MQSSPHQSFSPYRKSIAIGFWPPWLPNSKGVYKMIWRIEWFCMGLMLVTGFKIRGEDWTEFRGPTGQGIFVDGSLPVKWGQNKNLLWKKALPGKGWSSPIVFQGRIYVSTSVPEAVGNRQDQSLRVFCLDEKTGKTLWEQEVFHQKGDSAPN